MPQYLYRKLIPGHFLGYLAIIAGYLLPVNTSLAQNPVCEFGFKKIITLQGSQVVGGPHTDFPVLISHTDPDLATSAGKVTSASGFDIIFSDDSGNLLDFQLEKYDGATGQFVAWVRIPSITNGTDIDIHLLYGKSSITTDQSTTNVWGTNYQAVWHLNDDFLDHTSTSFDGVNNGSTDVVAKIADGQNFVDPNHWIELPSFPDLTSDFTLSGWAFTTDNTQPGQRIFADDANNTGGYALSIGDPGTGRIRFYARGTTPVILDSPPATIANNTWHYCVAVADISNNTKSLYVDGALVSAGLFVGAWGTDNGNASIGGEVAAGESANRFQGNLDEIRVANSALSANWIATEFNSQNQPILVFGASNPGDFYAVGSEEDIFHTSNGSGDWDQTSTWDSGQVPDGQFENVLIVNDDVDIDAGSADYTVCNCTLDGTGSLTRLDINSTRILTVVGDLNASHGGSGGNNTRLNITADAVVNVAGDMNWDRTNTNGSSRLQLLLRNNGVLNLTGNLVFTMDNANDILFDVQDNTDTNIDGNLDITIDGGDDFIINVDDAATVDITGDFIVDQNGADDLLIRINSQAGMDASISVLGNVSIDRSGGDDILFIVDNDNSSFSIAQDLNIISTGGGRLDFNLDNDATMDVDGDLIIDYASSQDAEIDLQGGNNPTFSVAGNATITSSGGVSEFLMDLNGGNFLVGQNITLNNTAPGTSEVIALEIDGDAIMNVGGVMAANLTGGDDILMELGNNSINSDAQLNVTGNATFVQNRSGANHIVQLLIFDNTQFTVSGDLTWTNSIANTSLTLMNLQNSGQTAIGGDVNLNAQSDGDLEIRLEDNSEFQIAGNFIRQGAPSNFGALISENNATVEYNGSSPQMFAEDAGAGIDGFTYGMVEINNSSASSPQLTMEGLATVNGGITFIDGVVSSDAVNLLVIANGASTNGASDASHVDGFVRKIGNTPAGEFTGNGYAFPVGDDDNYQPIYISAPSAASDQFDAQYLEANPHPAFDNTSLDPGILHISRNEHWILDRTAGSSSVTVRLTWDANSGGVGSLPDLLVTRWDGTTWLNEGNGGTTGDATTGTVVSAAAVTSFSPFTLGTTSSLNALPIELLSFEAIPNGNRVDLKWTTASETDNDFFTIERSIDVVEWENLITLPGAGNSNEVLNYQSADPDPYSGTSFYRLKQTDFDGQFSYSDIERVFIGESAQISIRPVPATNFITISAGTELNPQYLEIFNSLGQKVEVNIKPVTSREVMLDVRALPSGIYHLRITTALGISKHRLLLEN